MHRIDFRVSGFAARSCEEMCLHLCPSYVTSRPQLCLLFNEAILLVVSDIKKVADWLRTKFPLFSLEIDGVWELNEGVSHFTNRLENKKVEMIVCFANKFKVIKRCFVARFRYVVPYGREVRPYLLICFVNP